VVLLAIINSTSWRLRIKLNDDKSLRQLLIDSAATGNVLGTVHERLTADYEERDALAQELAMIHNEGLIDIVAAFASLERNSPNGPDFFLVRHVFENALPHLSAPVCAVMHCVLKLCREAGQDMAAGTIFSSYIEFCIKDAERPREALKLIEENADTLLDMLPATIVAGSKLDNPHYVAELLRLIQGADPELRKRAVFSLSRVHWPLEDRVPASVVTCLEEVVNTGADDHILASVIRSAVSLFEQDKALSEGMTALVTRALDKGDENALHVASEMFWLKTKDLPPTLLDALLERLRQVKPENVGTLNNIDLGVANLLKGDNPEPGLRLVEDLLVAHGSNLPVKVFDSATERILKSEALLGKVLTRWLLRGEPALCKAIREFTSAHYGNDIHISVDASELQPANDIHVIFVARKAIGYLFMKPVTAASIVVSLMRHATNEETLQQLEKLLFDPLLLNYTGSVGDYVQLQAASEPGKTKEAIESAMTSLDQYLEVLRTVPNLPALHASQAHRESYRRHMSESVAKSIEASEKKSVFHGLGLFKRSTLLYGNKSINYIYDGDGEPRRMEIPLSSHGVSMEFPRMDNIDPFGLDYMLRVFRMERLSV